MSLSFTVVSAVMRGSKHTFLPGLGSKPKANFPESEGSVTYYTDFLEVSNLTSTTFKS